MKYLLHVPVLLVLLMASTAIVSDLVGCATAGKTVDVVTDCTATICAQQSDTCSRLSAAVEKCLISLPSGETDACLASLSSELFDVLRFTFADVSCIIASRASAPPTAVESSPPMDSRGVLRPPSARDLARTWLGQDHAALRQQLDGAAARSSKK